MFIREWSETIELDLFVCRYYLAHRFYGEDIQNSMHVTKIDS
jgi:hypothetical protein